MKTSKSTIKKTTMSPVAFAEHMLKQSGLKVYPYQKELLNRLTNKKHVSIHFHARKPVSSVFADALSALALIWQGAAEFNKTKIPAVPCKDTKMGKAFIKAIKAREKKQAAVNKLFKTPRGKR